MQKQEMVWKSSDNLGNETQTQHIIRIDYSSLKVLEILIQFMDNCF
jgi:hypothetical protein